jgi:hypothetical protein
VADPKDVQEIAGLLKELAALPEPMPPCPDCSWPSWRRGCDVNYDESKHCLAPHLKGKGRLSGGDVVACLERTRDRLRSQLARAKELLQKQHELIGEAAEALEVDLG